MRVPVFRKINSFWYKINKINTKKVNMGKSRIHVVITGRVQGVGFRYSAFAEAVRLGLKGWVRNTYDNRVEGVFEGDDEIVNSMLNWCRSGPSMAHVTHVEVDKLPYKGEFESFRITR